MPRVETYEREDGLWDWRLIADNGKQQAESHQGFTTKTDARRGYNEAREAMRDAGALGEPGAPGAEKPS